MIDIPPEPLQLAVVREIDALDAEWTSLALASRNIFATPEWARTWWRSFGGNRRPYLVTARDRDGRLIVLIPFMISPLGPVRLIRFVGHGEGDLLGPIHAPGHETLAHTVLHRALREVVTGWDLFLGERLPGDGAWNTEPSTRVLGREANPVLALGRWPSWDAYVASLSQKLRYELRHDERALAARHRIQFHRTLTPDRLEADLDTMLALHRERWKRGRSSFTPREAFHRKFAAIALERGWLRLWILEVDGRPAAARYDFQYAGVHNAYNAGRDPAWRKEGVGLILRAHSMREAMNEGVSEYRFLRGAESYKTRFLTEDEGLVTIGMARTWLGRRVAQVGDFLKEHPQLRRMAAKVVRYRPPVGDEA